MPRVAGFALVTGVLCLTWIGRAGAAGPGFDDASLEFFENKVRPILAAKCLKCHGPEKQKGGLRLDSRGAVLKGGESGPAAVEGKPGESLLVDAVGYGEIVQMPPKSRLPETEVATLTRWVALGLPWPEASSKSAETTSPVKTFDMKARASSHWAWKPVQTQTPPDVSRVDWPLGPIDRFVLSRLESSKLRPAPEADKRTLIRRLSFDLLGLPPTPTEVEAYLHDVRPDAYERLVERLLASPRFGERWGRHWLDLVRYAESRGHEFDATIPNAWRYRDYVVRALNADVPYDRFVTEHVAGDLVETPRTDPVTHANESILGTGFWFLGEEVHSPVDLKADEADRMDNRLDVMTKTFLGLTVACARCHDHKFDAISQRDYYALNGFLISSAYRQTRFAAGSTERRVSRELRSLQDAARPGLLKLAARAARPGVDRMAETLLGATRTSAGGRWSEELARAWADEDHPLHPFASGAEGRLAPAARQGTPAGFRLVTDFGALRDLSRYQDGRAFGVRPARRGDLRFLGDPSDPKLGVVDVAAAREVDGWRPLSTAANDQHEHGRLGEWERAGQTLRTPEFTAGSGRLWYLVEGAGRVYASVNSHLLVAGPLHAAVLREWAGPGKRWRWVGHDLTAYKGHRLHLEFSPAGPIPFAISAVVESDREPPLPRHDSTGTNSHAGREAQARAIQERFSCVVDRMERDDTERVAPLADWLLTHLDLFAEADSSERSAFRDLAARVLKEREALIRVIPESSPTAPAMLDGNGVDGPLLIRGSSKTPGPVVPRRFLEAVAGDAPVVAADGGSGRLELARQLVAQTNPFTTRVMVNRVWHHLFGRGIVATVDNLGVMGEPPTHPELLDHLADSFVKGGWSVKRLVRTVVSSRAYRMASRPDPEADALDPENRLLHRRTIRRLQAEPLRDAILAVSGRLDGRTGGPSVPVHLTEFLQGRGRPATGPVDGEGRRSLYLATRRNFLSPMLLAFDAPIPFTTMGRRNVSNVPAQALTLMNDPFVNEQAGRWAGRSSCGDPAARVSVMYHEAFSRAPTPVEVDQALAFVAEQARELGTTADDRRPWADLGHVLFNAKEFVFID